MQLQFLALVELFLAVERLQFLTRAELLLVYLCSFARVVSRPHFVTGKGTFNQCGRSRAWNSTQSWKVRVPECVLLEKYEHQHVHIHIHIHIHIQIHVCFMCVYIYMCVYVCVFVFFVVWCRVMSCAARRWVVGCGVVWGGVVWCVRVLLSI